MIDPSSPWWWWFFDHGAVDGPNLGGCYFLSCAPPHLSGSSRPAGNERSSANEFEADCHPPLPPQVYIMVSPFRSAIKIVNCWQCRLDWPSTFFSNSPSVSFPYSVVCIPPIPLTSPSIYSHLLMLLDNSSMWLKAELFFWNTSIISPNDSI